MKPITFSSSVAVANDFAVRLLAGLLNVIADDEAEDCPVTERKLVTAHFSTEIIPRLRVLLRPYQMTRLEGSDSSVDPESECAANELRSFTIMALSIFGSKPEKIATFDVYREYPDGQGWTGWKIKNVLIHMGCAVVEISQQRLDRSDSEFVWGKRLTNN